MSYIFDALQRAQTERAKTDDRGSQAALEVLERAERQATSQRSSELLQVQPAEIGIEHEVPLFGGEGFGPGSTEASLTAVTNAIQDARTSGDLQPVPDNGNFATQLQPTCMYWR